MSHPVNLLKRGIWAKVLPKARGHHEDLTSWGKDGRQYSKGKMFQ